MYIQSKKECLEVIHGIWFSWIICRLSCHVCMTAVSRCQGLRRLLRCLRPKQQQQQQQQQERIQQQQQPQQHQQQQQQQPQQPGVGAKHCVTPEGTMVLTCVCVFPAMCV